MGFPQSILTSDERVVRHLHPHWKALVAPLFWSGVGVAGVVSPWIFLPNWPQGVLIFMTSLAVCVALVLGFWPWLRWRATHYVFTTERVIVRSGILARSGRDVPLGRINDVAFSHGIVDRMLGCGVITIESAGERGQVVLESIPQVEQLQSVLYELVDQDRCRTAGAQESSDRAASA